MLTGITPYERAVACWQEQDPTAKRDGVLALAAQLQEPGFAFDVPFGITLGDFPGQPLRPQLVHPKKLPRRGLGSARGHAAFVHAICHIEFSAINLALDHALRFAGLPLAYYRDWLRVAGEEAEHFGWLCRHLNELGATYGEFPAHDGLWAAALRTRHDPLLRMALVPRVLEARGLDVTPAMIARLRVHGDTAGAAVLEQILADEIGHVAVGSRWFEYFVRAAGGDSSAQFIAVMELDAMRPLNAELNYSARRQAGFSDDELRWLETGATAD